MVNAETGDSGARDATGTCDSDSARMLALAVEHLRDGCIFVDYGMRVCFLNATARRDVALRGEDAGAHVGRSLWDVLHYETDSPSRIAVESAANRRIPSSFTTRGRHGDYWVEVDVVPLAFGCLIYYRDATSRSSAEAARVDSESELQMTSERLRVLIDEAPLAVLIMDSNAHVLHWNPAAEAMFQWTAAEVAGRDLPIIPDDERETFEAHVIRTREGESTKAHATRRRRKDGVVLDVQVSSSPMRDRTGAVTGAIAMISDMTAHRKLELQLRMAQKMEAVGLLAGGVAHDFNNLLTAIKGFTSLLESSIEGDAQSAEFLGEIDKAADRAAALTAQLLAFSQRQLLRPEAVDLNARVRDLDRMLRVLLRDEGRLVFELDPELHLVLADPGQVEQVILNLVVNAKDAIRDRADARVTIRTSNAVLRGEFEQWGVEPVPGDYVRLDVEDNGTGMNRATQNRIFDPFFTTKEPGQGTGLGLATVFGIVKQSDGYVWVASEVDQGATFSIYLPRANTSERAGGPPRVPDGGGNECILLLEDEDAVRRVARRALELHGYRIVDAADGIGALKLADEHHIDLLLTDVMMPGMLGTAVATELRRRNPELPVLFMSGHSAEIVREGLIDPATPFLAKPFTPVQLAQKVREVLDQALAPRT